MTARHEQPDLLLIAWWPHHSKHMHWYATQQGPGSPLLVSAEWWHVLGHQQGISISFQSQQYVTLQTSMTSGPSATCKGRGKKKTTP